MSKPEETPAKDADPIVDSPATNDTAPGQDTADDTDWKSLARKWEARAKENKDAASKLAKYEESQKTEAQKQADRIAELEAKAAQADALKARYEVAAAKNVPADLLAGPGDDVEAFADALIKWRDGAVKAADKAPDAKPKGQPVPSIGKEPGRTGNLTIDEQIKVAHDNGDKNLEGQLKVLKLGQLAR
jgi:hypothetical protein